MTMMYCSQKFVFFVTLIISCSSSQIKISNFYDYASLTKIPGDSNPRTFNVPMTKLNGFIPRVATKGQVYGRQSTFYTQDIAHYYRIGAIIPSHVNTLNTQDGLYIQDVTSSNTNLLGQIQSHINNGISNAFPSPPTAAYITTMINVRASTSGSNGTTYQLIVATNGTNTHGILMITSVEQEAIARGDRAVVDYGSTTDIRDKIGTVALKFPYDGNIGQATTMSLNSNRGGEYIFSLNVPCPCKENLFKLACEIMKRKGHTDFLPNICSDST